MLGMSSNGCKIQSNKSMKKWEISPNSLKQLYPLLYKKIEIGGKFTFPITKQGIVKRISSIKIHTMDGASDSVQAPEGLANFHTHPLSCYIGEETVWGWPSGEDIRETLLFGMKGSLVHLVIAVEGIYSLQVNPCILSSFMNIESEVEKVLDDIKKSKKAKKLLGYVISKYSSYLLKNNNQESKLYLISKGIKTSEELKKYLKLVKLEYRSFRSKYKKNSNFEYLTDFTSDLIRGLIVLYIEIYYRASHRFRGSDLELSLFPIDFVKFVNSFKISNIFDTNKNIKGCGKLKCGGVPVYENSKNKSSNFTKYVDNYERDTGFYMVSRQGETLSLPIMVKKLLGFVPYIEDITIGDECSSTKTWDKNWFKMSFVPNDIIINGKKIKYISEKLCNKTKFEFLNHYFHDPNPNPNVIMLCTKQNPEFYYYKIKGECDHQDVTKDLLSYSDKNRRSRKKQNIKIVLYGSEKCGWCNRAIKKLNSKGIKFTKKYYLSIDKAIDEAKKLNKNVESIPAIFVNNKYMGNNTSKAVKYIIKNM